MTSVDYLGIIIIAFFMAGGYGKGFIRGFASTVQYVLGFIIAKIISTPLAEVVYDKVIAEGLRSKVFAAVDITLKNTMGESLEVVRDSILESVQTKIVFGEIIAEKMGSNWNIYSILKDGGTNISAKITNGIMVQLEPMIKYIVAIILFVILFFVLRIILGLVLGILTNIITSISITRTMDSVLGIILGSVKGVITATVVISLLYVLISVTGDMGPYLDESAFIGSKIFSTARSFINI